MSASLVPSALDARTQAFQSLRRLRSPASKALPIAPRSRQAKCCSPGDTSVPFFVLLSGAMEIVQPDYSGEYPIAKHIPSRFAGEMTMISGQRCLVVEQGHSGR